MLKSVIAVVALWALLPSRAQEPGAPMEDVRAITFFVAGVSCHACAVPVRSAVAKVPGIKDIDVSVEEKFLRFRFDARKTAIQTLMKSFLGDERFPSRLALQLENPKAEIETIEKARTSVAAVPGVRAMSLPDGDGVVLITFHLDKSTLLSDLLEAAKSAGVPLRDAPAKKPARPKDKE